MVFDALDSRELGQLRVGDLRAACQKRGLPTYGRKDELMARIVAADKAHAKKQKASQGRQVSPAPLTNRLTALCAPPGGTAPMAAVAKSSRMRCMMPNSPQMPGAASSASQWCLTSAVDDGSDASDSWRWTWTKSPARNDGLASPLRDLCPDSPQRPQTFARRRLRVKSPDPHYFALNDRSSGSPVRQHALLSPERRAPRRRLREKSPDPQRYDRDDWSRDFRPTRQASSPPALRKVSNSALGMSTQPCGRTERLSRSTPRRRLRHKTSLTKVVPHRSETSTASAGNDDPSAALMLLTYRELREMCVECDVSTDGRKMALVQRLLEAHAASAAPQRERTDHVGSMCPETDLRSAEGVICNVVGATSCSPAVRPSRRLSGGVPLPPSSWVSPQLTDDSNEARTSSSPEQVVLAQMPKSLLSTSPNNSPEVQQAASATPHVAATPPSKDAVPAQVLPGSPIADGSPVEHQDSELPGSSTAWWHQVKTRWPQIVANLRTASPGNVQGAVATSPSSPWHSESRKRQLGSPSIFADFQSPKRHCPTPLCFSPMLHSANALEGFR